MVIEIGSSQHKQNYKYPDSDRHVTSNGVGKTHADTQLYYPQG